MLTRSFSPAPLSFTDDSAHLARSLRPLVSHSHYSHPRSPAISLARRRSLRSLVLPADSRRSLRSRRFASILKYVIVGDAAVGKSCLLVRLTDDKFAAAEPTLGVEFGSKILTVGDKGKRVKVQCECRASMAEHTGWSEAKAHKAINLGRASCGLVFGAVGLPGSYRHWAPMRAMRPGRCGKAYEACSVKLTLRLGHGGHRELPVDHAQLLPRRGGRAARVRRDEKRE